MEGSQLRRRLESLMCDVDDFDPDDDAAKLRSDIAKNLKAAIDLIDGWPSECETLTRIAIQILEGN